MVKPFIHFNALGTAIKDKKRVVVLIDEVDKAPRDFPNDLLAAIEKLSFKVPELNNEPYTTAPSVRPIIILTSNSEKNLPDAFLRRVIYFHIDFPDKTALLDILIKKTGLSKEKATALVTHFQKTRDLSLKKKPATAEMLAWAVLLTSIGFPVEKLGGALSADEKKQLDTSYSVLAKTQEDLKALKAL
jgi:MoxR-like ATPase